MDLETNLTQIYASHYQESNNNYLKPNMNIDNDTTPFGVPLSQGFLQDFNHIDQFNVNGIGIGSSGVQIQTQNFDPFSATLFDVHEEFKPFVENSGNGNGNAYVMDNFLYGGYGLNNNIPQRNHQLEMMVTNQSYLNQDTKPLNFVVPDEVSCISSVNYYNRVGMNRNNNRVYSSTTRKTSKVRKKSNIVKGQWTGEEDGLLIQLVEKYGLRKWSHIAQILPGRIGKQCRERWHNHLRPDIKKDIWNEEEDKILIQAHAEIGNKWAEIAKRLPGRTENSIKNHWNATKRRQYSKRKCRSKYPRGTLLQEYIKSLNLDKNPPIDYRRKSSAKTNNAMKNKTSTTSKIAALPPAQSQTANQFFPSECLVPSYDFNEVPDFCFDENLFQEGCSIDSLLDDMSSEKKVEHLINLDEKNNNVETEMPLEIMEYSMFGVEVKKELDLVEMVSQFNENIKDTKTPSFGTIDFDSEVTIL